MENPKTILVVDDEEGIRVFVREYLTAEGYRVVEADNGRNALSVLKDNHVDLMITDIMMPEMDGVELFKTVRSMPQFDQIPIIMLTVRDQFQDIKEGHLMGADDYITKPFDPGLLIERARQALGEEHYPRDPLKEFKFEQ